MRTLATLSALFLLVLSVGAGEDKPVPVNAGTDSGRKLFAPPVREGFSFVIFGDRTTGRQEGLKLLDRAVEVTNRLDPEFVMTVGDLVQGYTTGDRWLAQAGEYKEHMGKLRAPWFPVVGNHDVYGGRKNRKGNVAHYKEHIGPLYYSFDYRFGHFVCLFSDESLSFSNPAKNQNMSDEQLAWLRADLAATKAKQIFVFLHHPRWNYRGTNWPAVHEILAKDGRVKAVFAGHLHTYRDDGVRDGIHYYVLAVTGGNQGGFVQAVSFQQIHLVRVRPDEFSISVLPMGSVIGSNAVLGSELDRMNALRSGRWLTTAGTVDVAFEGRTEAAVRASIANPTDREVAFDLELTGPEGYSFTPSVVAGRLKPGERREQAIEVVGPAFPGALPTIRLGGTLHFALSSGLVQPIHHKVLLPARLTGLPAERRRAGRTNRVLVLDGKSAVRVPLPPTTGKFTAECWVRGPAPAGRKALLSRMERSAFGIWWAFDKVPRAYGGVWVSKAPGGRGAGYVNVVTAKDWEWGRWSHLAFSWDGEKARMFLDGRPAGEKPAPGPRTGSALPLYVGADPDRSGKPGYFFTGAVDEVRLSDVARYTKAFKPRKVLKPDRNTLLLLHFDGDDGRFFADDSGGNRHGWPVGKPKLVEEEVK